MVWNEGSQRVFETLKKALILEPVLSSPDVTRPFIGQTDASDHGVGAALSKVGRWGHPVCYHSQQLLAREQLFSTIEKECFGYEVGVRCIQSVSTRQEICCPNRSSSTGVARKLKENIVLQPYSFVVEHRPGAMNLNSNALSGYPATALLQEKGKEFLEPRPTGMSYL